MSAPSLAQRAHWADEALQVFMARSGYDCEDSLAGLLAALMHWTDRSGQSFREQFYSASFDYAVEVAEDGES